MEDLLKYLAYSKELTINPFGLGKASCNNNCAFCIISDRMLKQDVPLQYFIDTTNNTKKWLNKYIDQLPEDITISFFFVAGELFYMSKDYFELYKKTAKELCDIVAKKYKKIRFVVQSNILSPNKEVIFNLVDLIQSIKQLMPNVVFTTSFDMYSRFNEHSLEIWKSNLEYIYTNIQDKIMVEMILLQPSILHYITKQDRLSETLDFILTNSDKYDVSFEDFILNDLHNIDLYPKTEDLVMFYKRINSKFPNHSVLNMYKRLTKNKVVNNKPKSECILIQFSDKHFDNGIIYTDEDLRIIHKNCLGGALSNLLKYPIKDILSFIPQDNAGLYCINDVKEVTQFFNKKCGFCKYNLFCKTHCFIQNIVKYKPTDCQHKAIFEAFNE